MFILAYLLASLLLATSAIAYPGNLTATRGLEKRQNDPKIAPGFSEQEVQQVQDAINDALGLAKSLPNTQIEAAVDVLGTWFQPSAWSTVIEVFQTIVSTGDGHTALTSITIEPHTGQLNGLNQPVCQDEDDVAEMLNWAVDNPRIVLCKSALKHGGIGKSYGVLPGYAGFVDSVDCDKLDDRVTYKMSVLGATLLHEYTHFEKFIAGPASPLDEETGDLAYGCFNCNSLRLNTDNAAMENADSYMWAALHSFWTTRCGTKFGPPTSRADDEDPACGKQTCEP